MKKALYVLLAAAAFGGPTAWAASADLCMGCHMADEFEGMTAAEVLDAAGDPSIAPHKKLADLSAEDLQAIAAELTGG